MKIFQKNYIFSNLNSLGYQYDNLNNTNVKSGTKSLNKKRDVPFLLRFLKISNSIFKNSKQNIDIKSNLMIEQLSISEENRFLREIIFLDLKEIIINKTIFKLESGKILYNEIISFLEEAGEMDDIQSLIYLSEISFHYNQDLKFIHYSKKLESLNNIIGIKNLAYSYHNGYGVELDLKKSFYYYNRAVELEDIESIYNLATCYFNGKGVIKNYEKAVELYKRASFYRDKFAIHELGYCYLNGLGVQKNIDKTLYLWHKAYLLGNYDSKKSIIDLYKKNIFEFISNNVFELKKLYLPIYFWIISIFIGFFISFYYKNWYYSIAIGFISATISYFFVKIFSFLYIKIINNFRVNKYINSLFSNSQFKKLDIKNLFLDAIMESDLSDFFKKKILKKYKKI